MIIIKEQDAILFFDKIFEKVDKSKYIEFRLIDNEKNILRNFFKIEEKEEYLKYIKKYEGKYNIFCGIQPRNGSSDSSDTDIKEVALFWADIDAKDFKGTTAEEKKVEAKKSITNFPLTPTMIIDSGNGYHVYWILDSVFNVSKDENFDKALMISKRVHRIVNADSTFNLSRILRVPGTRNIKNPDNMKFCKIDSVNSNFYSLELIHSSVNSIKIESIDEIILDDFSLLPSRIFSLDDIKLLVSLDVINDAKQIPERFDGDRSSHDFSIACKLYEAGLNDREVFECFKIFLENNFDVSQKFKDRGEAYLKKYTLINAKSKVFSLETLYRNLDNSNTEQERFYILDKILAIIAKKSSFERDLILQNLNNRFGKKFGLTNALLKKELNYHVNAEVVKSKKYSQFFLIGKNGVASFLPVKLAEYLIDKYKIITIHQRIYTYKDGYYTENVNMQIEKSIQEILDDKWSSKYSDETLEFIKIQTSINAKEAERVPMKVNLKNGIFDFESNSLLPHNTNIKFLYQINANFNKDAKCERLDKFMEEVFKTKEQVYTMWENVGYILLGKMNLKRFLVLVGSGDNGKSVFLRLLIKFLGEDNVSSDTLQRLAGDRFSASNLFGKLANISADLDEEDVRATGMIKSLTGDDLITADRKFLKPFQFKNTAHLIFSCNQLPILTNGGDEAFYNRLQIVQCLTKFNEETRDVNLFEKISTEEAMSTFLNRAIEGGFRLLKNKDFTISTKHHSEYKENYKKENDSVIDFFFNNIKKTNSEHVITKADMYNSYTYWCALNTRKPVSKIKFSKRAKASFSDLCDTKIRCKKEFPEDVWIGVVYQEEFLLLMNKKQSEIVDVGTMLL